MHAHIYIHTYVHTVLMYMYHSGRPVQPTVCIYITSVWLMAFRHRYRGMQFVPLTCKYVQESIIEGENRQHSVRIYTQGLVTYLVGR